MVMKNEDVKALVRIICEKSNMDVSDFIDENDKLTKLGTLAVTFTMISFALKFAEFYERMKGVSKDG